MNSENIPSQYQVIKTFPPQGQLQQFRLASITKFTCASCEKEKTSKLIVVESGGWDRLWCNGCYGLQLSKSKT
ncbi:hypothetical protein F5Y16DRAFT_387668 [Xylariaceae sp. FL0255]|nr:hypothetical protein F5Y16DRAFT_387668 [Xylariaceae sp. FL0255]